MPHHHERRELPYSATQMFDLVADVRKYSEFLPWVTGMRVRAETEQELLADMIVGFKSLRKSFSCRVNLTPKTKITVDYLDGPMKHLTNLWSFEDHAGGGCTVEFTVDFAFRNAIFEAIAGQFFESALRKMTSAFIDRADNLYG